MSQEQFIGEEERLARLALYLGVNGNPSSFYRVMHWVGSALEAFNGRDLGALGINVQPLLRGSLFEDAHQLIYSAQKSGFGLLVWGAHNYPERLFEVADPPPLLWVKGTLEPGDKLAVSLVGSRQASRGGLLAARRLAREGAAMGLTIISGLAKGVDTQVHRGALEAGGRTVGVLGCGLDWVYPKENAALYEEIAQNGAVVSEFSPATRPAPVNFPRRNRVIAGLSLAVVVVEAGERSGALITARLGLELNREVMALPGPAGALFARGANRLIKNGAALVENMAEVVLEIKPRLLEGLTSLENAPQLEDLVEDDIPMVAPSKVNTRNKPSPGNIPKVSAPVGDASRPKAEPLNDLKKIEPAPLPGQDTPEGQVLEILRISPLDTDSLIRATGLEAASMASLLLNLELEGLITRLTSGQYQNNQ